MMKGRVVEGDSAKSIVVNEQARCAGCAVKSCGGNLVTFSMPSSLDEGPVAIGLSPSMLGRVLLHSLGLPLVGMVGGVVFGVILQWSEGSQFVLGCLGFGILASCCRVFDPSLITVMREEN